jgi:hypothetical protein
VPLKRYLASSKIRKKSRDIGYIGTSESLKSAKGEEIFNDPIPLKRFRFGKYEHRTGWGKPLLIFGWRFLVGGGLLWWLVETLRQRHFFDG